MTQAEKNEAAAGAPGTIELGGTTYLVAQPDDRTFAALNKHFREQMQNPIQAIADDLKYLPPEYRRMAIDAAVALKAGGGVEVSEAFIRERLMEPAGCAFLAWLLILPNHPEVTQEAVRAHVTPDNVMDTNARLFAASGMKALVEGKTTGRRRGGRWPRKPVRR
jgi:hypothetical protein